MKRNNLLIRLRRGLRTLPVDECVSHAGIILYRCAAVLRLISQLADNPPKPWHRGVVLWRYHGLCPWGPMTHDGAEREFWALSRSRLHDVIRTEPSSLNHPSDGCIHSE